MKTTVYTLRPGQREDLMVQLREELERQPALRFAYLHGSVLESDQVHDVDVGIFLDDSAAEKASVADRLSAKLTTSIGMPVDIRMLNDAPLSFVYHVLRGHLLSCRDEAFLTDLLENVPRRYLDLAPLLRSSTKDAFAA